ncbi:MAG: Gfo/Idh/MocA family oxidoreductase [Candidatus Omnitrophica bacterium]|nr:Gfo/Idh/MocA family oxidoreductase [Candidatus Omnitrophota bacterium]
MKKIKIAIIGIGHLGARHLKIYSELSDQVEIIGVCDIKEDRALAQQYKTPFFADYHQLAGKIDAVCICVPTLLHYEIARFFLNNGIHTFIEKPITTTLEQADELVALAKKADLRLQIGHVERFNAAFQSIKHFTKDPLFIECHRLNHFPNRSLDIGVVMDLMIHDIDIVLGLISCPIERIDAVGVNVLTPLDDIASVRLTFANGCVCNLTASRISDEVLRKIRLFQKDTYISLDYVKQEAFIYKRHARQILKHALPIEQHEPLKKENEHFIACVRDHKRPLIAGEEGREALKVALEITQQIRLRIHKPNGPGKK